jgi:segregation and condensation protein B
VEEAGADAETGAHLYRTTSYFLERIGITSLDQLPELAPFVPDMDDSDLEEAVAGMSSPVVEVATVVEDAHVAEADPAPVADGD